MILACQRWRLRLHPHTQTHRRKEHTGRQGVGAALVRAKEGDFDVEVAKGILGFKLEVDGTP